MIISLGMISACIAQYSYIIITPNFLQTFKINVKLTVTQKPTF